MSTPPASKPFALLPHLYDALASALQATPPNATSSPRELCAALVAIAQDFAGASGVDPLEMLATAMPCGDNAATVADEARALDLVRRCYAAARKPVEPSN